MTPLNKTLQLTTCLFLLILLLAAGTAWAQSGTLSSAAFGMQCGPDKSTNCPLPITLPIEPGTLRLWDSKVEWSALNPSCSQPPCTNWAWTYLDDYLDAIVADSSLRNVIYTFGWVPCWDANVCSDPTKHRTSTPPSDLGIGNCGSGGTGSCTFDTFVQALTTHCNASGNCVGKCPAGQVCARTNLIKYYELWNEANSTTFWNGTALQLYDLVKPAVAIIKQNVTGAVILTPSATAVGGENWMATSWLPTEVSGGIVSNIYNFHTYLDTSTPETRWTNAVQNAPGGLLYPNFHTTGWTALPWMNSETNFENGGEPNPYTCDSIYNAADCTGQVVRWQLLLNSNGAVNVSWYYWNTTIGDLGAPSHPYATAYYWMMQYLLGGRFTAACSLFDQTNQIWTCPFVEGNNAPALFVWTTNEANANFTVPTGYSDYRDLNGGTTGVTTGEQITVTVEPIMLEGPIQ